MDAILEKEIGLFLKADLATMRRRGYSLADIHQCVQSFLNHKDEFETALGGFVNELGRVEPLKAYIHSIRFRLKDPLHLAEKLARKACAKKSPRNITLANLYHPRRGVTDLLAVRILHLVKQDWVHIHEFLTSPLQAAIPHVRLVEKVAWVRPDDSQFNELNSDYRYFSRREVKRKEAKYSSMHYVFQLDNWNPQPCLELQVRTLFEEGWGELDHTHRYPSRANAVVEAQLSVLNKAASMANEVVAAIGAIDNLPRFIPWEQTLRLERSSDRVRCFSPTLEWAAANADQISDQLRRSDVKYLFLVAKTAVASRNHRKLQSDLKKLGWRSPVLGRRLRVKWYAPSKLPFVPAFADLLLLEGAADWTARVSADFGIVGAPAAQQSKRREDKQDMLIAEQGAVLSIRRFFDHLEKRAV